MSDDAIDMDRYERERAISQGAKEFQREIIIAKLEAELLQYPMAPNERDHRDLELDNAYRKGWNDRARALVEWLRGGKS